MTAAAAMGARSLAATAPRDLSASRLHFESTSLQGTQSTLLPGDLADAVANDPDGGGIGSAVGENGEGLKSLVARLEGLQMAQRSPQQPNPELDQAIIQAITARPEWRQRMAVMTKSPWLRRKILMAMADGGRAIGCHVLGSTHQWVNRVRENVSDHNWPKMAASERGPYLPGGPDEQARHLRGPADKVQHHPLLHAQPSHSIPRAKRFHGLDSEGKPDKKAGANRHQATPGPGEYHRSLPRGPHFLADQGETVVLGANHMCPWKSVLGHNINPVECDHTVLPSAPIWTFPKTRRMASEVASGFGGGGDGGAVKTDRGCLSPGNVYEHVSSFRPAVGKAPSLMRKSHSTSAITRRRCYPVDPEPAENAEDS